MSGDNAYLNKLMEDFKKCNVIKAYYERNSKLKTKDKPISFEEFVEDHLIDVHRKTRKIIP